MAGRLAPALVESLAGILLVVLGALLALLGGASVSPLPLLASFSVFASAALASRNLLKKRLERLYLHRRFSLVSTLAFLAPLLLLLHVGYEYAYSYMSVEKLLELAASMTIGLGAFIAAYPLLREV
ncbi:MAG: hypothetical protein ACP5KA_04565 [Desulfurococcaceae archaeon]